MPDIAPVALSDVALATSTANAISVSRGPGSVPLYDTNIAWDPATKRFVAKGQAIGSGGDRHQWQDNAGFSFARFDSAGRLVRDHTNTELAQYGLMILPDSLSPPISFGSNSAPNDDGGTTNNPVLILGHNQPIAGNQAFDPTRTSAGLNIEGYWLNANNHYQAEYYFTARKPNGAATRAYIAEIILDLPGDQFSTLLKLAGSQVIYILEDLATPLRTMQRFANGSYSDIVFNGANPDGSDSFPLSFGEDPAKASVLTIGRLSGTSRMVFNGTQTQLVVGANGQLSVGVAGDVVPFARFGFAGSNALIGLYGTCTNSSAAIIQIDNTQSGNTLLALAPNGNCSFSGPIGVNGASPPAKAAAPGTASGTDAAVINAVVTILHNAGFCS